MLTNLSGERFFTLTAVILLPAFQSTPSHAAIAVNNVSMLRDFRGPNDVGVASGDLFQYSGIRAVRVTAKRMSHKRGKMSHYFWTAVKAVFVGIN